MKREERQIFNFIKRFKLHIQDHVVFKPTAISNLHHMADRLLDRRDGSFRNFVMNIKEMLKSTQASTQHGGYIIVSLWEFVTNGSTIEDFIDIVENIYDSK